MNTSKKSIHFSLQPVSAACLMLIMLTANNLSAAPLNLAQVPAGNSGSEPAPNVILSVDDSGSMGWDVNGCRTRTTPNTLTGDERQGCPTQSNNNLPTRLTSLRNALINQFGDGTSNSGRIEDGRIRLAWQSMWNNGNAPGANTLTPGGVNTIRPFENSASGTAGGAQHRTNFNAFVTSLASANGTPSHSIVSKVDTYMRETGVDSPWKNRPGVSNSPELSCRRSYHIFMTDGSWNNEDGKTSGNPLLAQPPAVGNVDGRTQPLPTPDSSVTDAFTQAIPIQYIPFTPQTRIYGDNWARSAGTTQTGTYGGNPAPAMTQPRNLGTLSDFVFRSWVQDLQTGIPNAVWPKISVSGNQTVGTGANATVLPEFWNPKNNPATWQHVVTHTIGFGNTASAWVGAPAWDATSDDPYAGDYTNLVNGSTQWGNPMVANINCANNNNLTGCIGNAYRASELWHMAVNGRGRFYPVRTPAALTSAFNDILNNVLTDTTSQPTSISSNGASLSANSKSYVAGYDAKKWSGSLKAFPINATTGVVGTTETWSATGLGAFDVNKKIIVNDPGKLDDPNYSVSNRLVVSYNGTAGIEWKTFTSLPALQRTPLNQNNTATVDNNGQNRLNYIRGDRSKEQSQTGGIFRNRDSRLGDIANSKILYLGKPVSNYGEPGYAAFKRPAGSGNRANMLYVGANDGMLHAFDAATGVEKLAYIPQGIAQGDLRKLTDPNYTHQYFVDGTPFTGDAKVGTGTASTNPWKTVLVAGLGAGGKGYVALDATNALNFVAGNESNLVIADTTATTDPDIGKMFITPAIDPSDASRSSQIVRVNANNADKYRWALVVGNGYNSTNEAPVLIVQYLDGANDVLTGQKEIKKISPCISVSSASAGAFDNTCAYKTNTGLIINGSTSNGLSTPRTVDLNDDGIVDVAYAGDLAGNLWKFDLSSKKPSEWKTSFANQPLFKAKPKQSFTTAPYVDSNFTAGAGVQVHISSGKNLTTNDQTTNDTETTYSLWDNSRFGQKLIPNTSNYKFEITDSTPINTSNVIPDTLIQQTISTSPFTSAGNSYYTSSSNSVDYERASGPDRGWYMDWRIAGQRVLRNSKSFDGQKISIYSTVPSSAAVANNVESCSPGLNSEKNYLTILNMFTGKPSKARTFDLPTTIASANPGTTTVELPPGDFVEVKTRNANGKLGAKVVSTCKAGQACKPPIDTPWGSYVGVKAGWGSKQ